LSKYIDFNSITVVFNIITIVFNIITVIFNVITVVFNIITVVLLDTLHSESESLLSLVEIDHRTDFSSGP